MKQIITKYLEGHASEAEQAELLKWLRNKENSIVFNSFKLDWKKNLDAQQLPKGSEGSWSKIQGQLLQRGFKRWQSTRKINQLFRYAAIFFFVISMSSLAYLLVNRESTMPEYFTSVMAENGQISKVELPDGSLVWLNSGSEITYSNFFATDNRNIKLTGEAYCQVTKNEDIPLIVNSGDLQVKVLGTKFNVAAYRESDKIDVVLESGEVELLSSKVESFSYKLAPGERATFNKSDRKLAVSNVNTSKFTSWKDGMINIYNQSLEELVERLEVRYNQEFEYDDDVKDFHYTFTIKNESLDEVIKLMEKITLVNAVQKGDTIIFKKDKKREAD
ncbi:MAG: FecR domain-containing protein [Bacteroidota bacterium]